MYHLVYSGLVKLLFGYAITWLCYTAVYAGTFTLIAIWTKQTILRENARLEFWIAALAALCSLAFPLWLIWSGWNVAELLLPLFVVLIGINMDLRKVRMRELEPEQFHGDILGYLTGLSIIIGRIWMSST